MFALVIPHMLQGRNYPVAVRLDQLVLISNGMNLIPCRLIEVQRHAWGSVRGSSHDARFLDQLRELWKL